MQAADHSGSVPQSHSLQLDERKRLSVSGVLEVESFDDTVICLSTTLGNLVIRGEALSLQQLSMEGGNILVEGSVEAMLYEPSRPAGSFLSRLFG